MAQDSEIIWVRTIIDSMRGVGDKWWCVVLYFEPVLLAINLLLHPESFLGDLGRGDSSSPSSDLGRLCGSQSGSESVMGEAGNEANEADGRALERTGDAGTDRATGLVG
jgi:hypothetical protein